MRRDLHQPRILPKRLQFRIGRAKDSEPSAGEHNQTKVEVAKRDLTSFLQVLDQGLVNRTGRLDELRWDLRRPA